MESGKDSALRDLGITQWMAQYKIRSGVKKEESGLQGCHHVLMFGLACAVQ